MISFVSIFCTNNQELKNIYLECLLVFLVFTASEFTEDCICEHCKADKVIGLENPNGPVEDSDGDGNRTICARDRDYDDRSFPSICHMLCYNRCTRFGLQTIQANNEDIETFAIFRTSKTCKLFITFNCIMIISLWNF